MNSESGDRRSVLSRGEVENACILSAISDEGCALSDLPARLGLSPLLGEPVKVAIAALVNAGWIQEADGSVSVTQSGRAWLNEQF